jgi:hypothetical protein
VSRSVHSDFLFASAVFVSSGVTDRCAVVKLIGDDVDDHDPVVADLRQHRADIAVVDGNRQQPRRR